MLHVAHSLLARIIHLPTALAVSVFGSLPHLERWQIITVVILHLHCVRNMQIKIILYVLHYVRADPLGLWKHKWGSIVYGKCIFKEKIYILAQFLILHSSMAMAMEMMFVTQEHFFLRIKIVSAYKKAEFVSVVVSYMIYCLLLLCLECCLSVYCLKI